MYGTTRNCFSAGAISHAAQRLGPVRTPPLNPASERVPCVSTPCTSRTQRGGGPPSPSPQCRPQLLAEAHTLALQHIRPVGRARRRTALLASGAAAASTGGNQDGAEGDGHGSPSTSYDTLRQPTYTLEQTRTLVETAMLAAVSGLAYLLSTILKLENSLGYFLPLPVVLAALRSGAGAGWRTMMATCFLLVVLLGPLRALSYLFLHGLLAATLGSLWSARADFWAGVAAGACVRMAGQLAYLVMSSVTMNENMFALLLSNVYNMLDQLSATLNMTGAPSPLAVSCMVFSLLLVNGLTYTFLLHVVYRVVLGAMGYQLGPLPGLVANYLRAGVVRREDMEAEVEAEVERRRQRRQG